MKKPVKILSAILGFMILLPGLAKFTEPFKTFILQHLTIIGFPFPELMQYAVKFSEIGVGLVLVFLAFSGQKSGPFVKRISFYTSNLIIVVMMLVAIYTHMHPNVPAEILPLEFKPPVMPLVYIVLVLLNLHFYRTVKNRV